MGNTEIENIYFGGIYVMSSKNISDLTEFWSNPLPKSEKKQLEYPKRGP